MIVHKMAEIEKKKWNPRVPPCGEGDLTQGGSTFLISLFTMFSCVRKIVQSCG